MRSFSGKKIWVLLRKKIKPFYLVNVFLNMVYGRRRRYRLGRRPVRSTRGWTKRVYSRRRLTRPANRYRYKKKAGWFRRYKRKVAFNGIEPTMKLQKHKGQWSYNEPVTNLDTVTWKTFCWRLNDIWNPLYDFTFEGKVAGYTHMTNLYERWIVFAVKQIFTIQNYSPVPIYFGFLKPRDYDSTSPVQVPIGAPVSTNWIFEAPRSEVKWKMCRPAIVNHSPDGNRHSTPSVRRISRFIKMRWVMPAYANGWLGTNFSGTSDGSPTSIIRGNCFIARKATDVYGSGYNEEYSTHVNWDMRCTYYVRWYQPTPSTYPIADVDDGDL